MATGLNPLIITCYYLELSVDCDSLLPPPCVRWAHHPGDYQSTGHDCVHAACCWYYAINFRSWYPSSPFTSVEQYLRYVIQTKFWLATIIVFKSCYTICSLDCLWLYRTYIFTWGEQVCYTIFSGWLASSYFSHLYLLYLWKKKSFFGCNKCYQHWSDMCSATACVQQLSQPYSLYYFYRTIIGVFKTLSSG